MIYHEPEYRLCACEYPVAESELSSAERVQHEAAVQSQRDRVEALASWAAQVRELVRDVDDGIARIVMVVAAYAFFDVSDTVHVLRPNWAALREVMPGLWPDEDTPYGLLGAPPWDHEAVHAWFLGAVEEPPGTCPLAVRTSPLRMFLRGYSWEPYWTTENVPGWFFDRGSTYFIPSETHGAETWASTGILEDGRRIYGAGRLEPINPAGDGFNAFALRDMAELAHLPKLPPAPPPR